MNTATDSLIESSAKNPGGNVYGQSSSDLIAFYGAAPVARVTVANLTGTITGSANGTMEDVPAATAAGGEATAAELTAVNTAITSVNLQNKELFTKLNALIDALQLKGLIG